MNLDSFTLENVSVLVRHGDDGVDGGVSAQHAAGLSGHALVGAASADGGRAEGGRGGLGGLLAVQSLQMGVGMKGRPGRGGWREVVDSAGGGMLRFVWLEGSCERGGRVASRSSLPCCLGFKARLIILSTKAGSRTTISATFLQPCRS